MNKCLIITITTIICRGMSMFEKQNKTFFFSRWYIFSHLNTDIRNEK